MLPTQTPAILLLDPMAARSCDFPARPMHRFFDLRFQDLKTVATASALVALPTVLVDFAISTLIGIWLGPVLHDQAARLDPIEVLRHE
jgi:hypothetical protein